MAEVREPRGWSEEDTEAFFYFLGKYLYFFQWIEGELDMILLLTWGDEGLRESHARLARMGNKGKIDKVRKIVLESPDFKAIQAWNNWCEHFMDVIDRLHKLRKQRNAIMHSQYLFEFTEFGLPPVRSHRYLFDKEVGFDRQSLDKDTQKEIMRDVVVLAVDLNFVHTQLVHAYRSPADFGALENGKKWRPASAVIFDGHNFEKY